MRLQHKVQGFAELDKLLKNLPKRVENNVLQKATMDTLKRVVLGPMKQAAPRHKGNRSAKSKEYGTLLSNIRVKRLRSKRKGERGASISTGKAFWGYILEKGSRYISAKPWFFPTFASRQNNMIQELGQQIGAGIEREAAKEYKGGR